MCWAPVPPAGRRARGFHGNWSEMWPRGPPPPLLCCPYASGWRWHSLGPGQGAGEMPRDGHSRDRASHNSL